MKFSVPGLTSLHLTNKKDTGEVLHFRPSALFWVSQVKAGPVEGHGMTAKSADQNDHRFAVGFGQNPGEHRCSIFRNRFEKRHRSSGTNAKHEISLAITVCRAFRLRLRQTNMPKFQVLEQDLRSGRIRTRRNCGRQKLKSGLYIPILTLERTRHVLRDQQVALRNVGHEIIVCLGMRQMPKTRAGISVTSAI